MASLLQYIGIGLLGGLILNVMPCVLPVLTMKLFHVLEHGSSDARARQTHGLAYAAGILTAFLALAIAVIVLRASGERVGWGMQFQHPPFVATMIALIYVFGLNALGVFELNISVHGHHHQGYTASYFNGIFAAVMSTPCSAPFLGTAAAFALGAGAIWWQTLAMFLAIGLGLSSPFLLVSFIPSLAKLLPRPGPWMETFKSLMGFTLLGAAVWLFGTLQAQVTPASAHDFLIFLLILAIALWGTEQFGGVIYSNIRRLSVRLVALAVVIAAGWGTLSLEQPARAATAGTQSGGAKGTPNGAEHIAWTPFDLAQITAENKRGRPVLADFTAEWCANCKTNDKLFVDTTPVRDRLRTSGILPMKADLTNNDDALWDEANALGRTGIPIYVLYLPDGTRDLLPEAITTEMLVAHLDAAAKKFPRASVAKQ
jgi:thiol:disulfide interchange protein